MPRMLDKYTQEEETALTEINQKYSEPLKAAYARLDAALEAWTKRDDNQSREYYQALEDEMEAASAAANKINEAMLSETAAIQDDAEKRLFLSYGGDMAAMEEMIRENAPRIVATGRAFAGPPPSQEERDQMEARAKESRKAIIDAIQHNEELIKRFPDDQQLKKDTDGLKKMLEDGTYSPKPLFDLIFSGEALKKSLLSCFSMYLDFFKENDKERYDRILSFIDACIAMREEYEKENNSNQRPKKREYRTKAKAKEQGAITEAPKSLITPTYKNYQYSMSLYQDGNAYLQPMESVEGLKFERGKLYFVGQRMREVSEAELRDLRTKKGIQEIDLSALQYCYSILYDQFQRSGYKLVQDYIVVSVSLLAGRNNPKDEDVNAVIRKIQSYHNIMGVIKTETPTGKIAESYYQVLNFEYYDKSHNIIAFSSPYMNYVIKKLFDLSINRGNNKKVTRKKRRETNIAPTHSYLIDSSIVRERNKGAVENVIILVALIEQAGKNIPRIKASTLIERNVQLAERLATSRNPRALLKTTFTKTWELLRTKTRLQEVYQDIELPDPKDPAFIPTMATLDKVVFTFQHKGKKNT